MCLASYICTLYSGHDHLQGHVFLGGLEICTCVIIITSVGGSVVVSALYSVVAGSISSGGDHSLHCGWDLISSKQLSSVSVCCVQVFAGFSGHGNSIHNIILLLEKENVHPGKVVSKLAVAHAASFLSSC